MKRNIFVAALLLFVIGCTSQQSDQLTQQQKDQIKSEVKAVCDSLRVRFERMDFDGALKFFWDSPEVVSYNADGSRSDFEALKKSFTDAPLSIAAVRMATAQEEFRVLARDFVIYSWVRRSELVMKSGDKMTQDPDATTWVFKKVEGQWKVIYGHDSGTIMIQKAGTK